MKTIDARNPKNTDIDFFPTPPVATEALLEREKFGDLVLEPACGDGAISQVLDGAGYSVVSTDLKDHGYGQAGVDFRDKTHDAEWFGYPTDIVTNPPYKFDEEFAWRCLEVASGKVAMLLRLKFLEAQRRYRLFTETPLKKVYVFSYRVPFQAPDLFDKPRTDLAVAWFVWDHHYEGEPTIGWISK